jgi:O-antigen/teichoic acid export membrane protein
MSTVKTLAKNTTVLLAADVISKVLSFFLIVFIARHLGDVGLGKYSFVFAFVGLFALFSDFGISTFLTREVAKDKTKTSLYFDNIITLKLILTIVATILPLIVIWFIDKSVDVKMAVYIMAIAMFFLNYEETFGALIRAYEKMEYISLMMVLEKIITAGLGIVFLAMGFKLVALVSAFLVAYFTTFVIYYIIITKKITKIRFRADFGLWKKILKQSLPFWLTVLFIAIYFRIDIVMLTMMKGYQSVGWFSASHKILDALYFIPGAIIMAVFPVMSRLHIENKEQLSKLYKKAFYYLLSLGVPIGIGATLLADRIILFVYKDAFINSVIALQILIWAEVFIFISSVSGYLLNSIDKQKLFSYVTGICAVINVTLNLILIPKYDYIGASVATVITEILVFAMLFYFVSKNKYGFNLLKVMIKPAVAGIVMAVGVVYFKGMHLLILVPFAMLVYFSCLFIIKGIDKEEIDLVKGLVKRE